MGEGSEAVPRLGRLPLVGRAREVALLRAIAAGERAAPRALLLRGESGIGKSRLLRELRALAEGAGWRVLGAAADEAIGLLPYYPWVQVFRAYLRDGGDPAVRATLAAGAAELLPLLPELADAAGEQPAPAAPGDAGRKLRLFDAVTAALEGIAATAPTAILLDDIQWLDPASVELLRYAAVQLDGPLLLALAGRGEELARHAALVQTLDDLNRRRLLEEIALPPLAPEATAALLAAARGPADAGLAAALHAQSEGNPFFAEELIKALGDGAAPTAAALAALPPGIVAVVAGRLRALGDDCLALLRVAALIGRRFPLDLAAEAAGFDLDAAAGLLDEAVAAALRPLDGAAEEGEFAHDRIREVILRGLNPLRRRALHGRLAAALEGRPGRRDPLRLATLAFHFGEARDRERAARYARAAGDAAMRTHAHAEAATYYRQALDLADADGADATELLLLHGDAALAAGDYVAATSSYAEAARAAVAAGSPRVAGRAERQLGAVCARREELDAALDHYRRALHLLDEGRDDPDTAELLVQFGAIHGLSIADYAPARDYGERGLAMAARLGVPRLEATARLALANTIMRAGDLAAGRAVLLPALDLATLADDPNLAAEVSAALANLYYWVGDLARSQAATERRADLARRGGDPYAARHVLPWLAHLAYARGDWDAAAAHLAAAEPLIARLDSPEPRAFHRQIAGLVLFQRGDFAGAAAALGEAVAVFRRIGPGTLIWYLGCFGRAQLAAGDASAARRTLAELDALCDDLPPGALPCGPALAQLALAAAELGDLALAARTYPRLLPYAGQHHWVLMDRALGALAVARGDWGAAAAHLNAAEATAGRGGIAPELALAIETRAALHARRDGPGDRAAAENLLHDARARFAALGMAAGEARVAALLAAPAPPAATRHPAGLSAREVEVLRLVVAGRTNREIADLLSLSERTVNNHVAHILTKTNAENRAAAAAFALRHGLA